MEIKKGTKLIIGNWKMYKTIEETVEYIQELKPLVQNSIEEIYLAVPFTAIRSAAEVAEMSNIVVGAQNMHDVSEGAFTGEIAARMLIDAGAKFVILGHSERRRLFHESNELIHRKINQAINYSIQPILCIGETKEEHQDKLTYEVIKSQLQDCLKDFNESQLDKLVIAYEPVWAIGTDLSASAEDAQSACAFCREWLSTMYEKTFAERTKILYGGSVKPANAKALLEQKDVDGLLVGGASLSAQEFSLIINGGNTI